MQYAEEFVTAPTTIVNYLSFNCLQPPFNDPRVRKALGLAFDRKNFIFSTFEGGGVFPATGGLLSPAMPGHSEGLVLPYNLPEARRLLAEAGYPSGNGFPVIKARLVDPNLIKFLESQWQHNLGIKVKWIELPLEKFREFLENKALNLWGWEDWPRYPAPELILDGRGIKTTGWFNQRYQELINRAAGMVDYEKRFDLYRQAEQILLEEVPVLPICYRRLDYLVKPWCRNFPSSPSKAWYWKELIIDPH